MEDGKSDIKDFQVFLKNDCFLLIPAIQLNRASLSLAAFPVLQHCAPRVWRQLAVEATQSGLQAESEIA